MGLAAEIVRFFYIDICVKGQSVKTIDDFSKSQQGWEEDLDLNEVFRICTRLEHHGYLMEALSQHEHPVLGRSFVAPNYEERRAQYGEYDFVGYGFALMREKLGAGVRPVVVIKADGSEDIGTSFLLGNQTTIVTARHVIENKPEIRIPDGTGRSIRIQKIIVPKDRELDVAILIAEERLIGVPYFRCENAHILDEVMCLGFPPIPGFQEMLISDVATVNAVIKSSAGRVVSTGASYLDQQKYYLINARVKGGNSGGPILNYQGYVVGVLVQTAMDSGEFGKLDSLGYGIATPKAEWINLLDCDGVNKNFREELIFENLKGGGFRTDI